MYYTTLNFAIESKNVIFLLLILAFVIRCRPKDIALIEPFDKPDE